MVSPFWRRWLLLQQAIPREGHVLVEAELDRLETPGEPEELSGTRLMRDRQPRLRRLSSATLEHGKESPGNKPGVNGGNSGPIAKI
jgi:hypothetical protein